MTEVSKFSPYFK